MALDVQITGNLDANNNVKVALPLAADQQGGIRVFSENDPGVATGVPRLRSPEVDVDFRQRVSQDLLLEEEVFNYTAQNTAKHSYANTTMTATWTAGRLTTNASSIITTTTAVSIGSYAFFPNTGTQTLSFDFEAAFSAQPVANTLIDFGGFIRGAANPYAPTDGVYFRLTSAGLVGVVNSNGSEVQSGVFESSPGVTWKHTNDKNYQFIVYLGGIEAQFWINDGTGPVLMASIPCPAGTARICMSGAIPWSVRHAIIGGAAGGTIQFKLGAVNVRLGGSTVDTTACVQGNRIYGGYQGLSGGTMGSLATYPNSTNPTAAAPSNTALTANLPGGLGGQGAVIAAAAAATDGIWGSYQVPAGTPNFPGRRLVIRGAVLDLVNLGAAVATTATVIQFSIAFGHTAVSLATAEATTTKAPRRVPMGIATWPVGAAIGQQPQGGRVAIDFGDAPIFVNPGEFVAMVGKFLVGTATASQVINFTWTPIYGWE